MIATLIKNIRFAGGKYNCIVCGKNIRTYFRFSDSLVKHTADHGFPYSYQRMETLNFDRCNCPFCLSADRERLYLLYLEKYIFKTLDQKKQFSMLDFAPNFAFANYLKKKGIDYVSADFLRDDMDLKLDICNMSSIANDRFDFIICSHILEHVPSPEKALEEMHRILKPGGNAIIMVPLFWDVKETAESPDHVTEEERWKNYGQDDHVRLFAKQDFLNRIKKAGFNIKEFTVKDFESSEIDRNAISSNSILYVAHKS